LEKELTCAFTGHREGKLPWRGDETDARCIALKQSMDDALQAVYAAGIRHFICGMATGCDTYFCEALIRLRQEHKDVSIEAAIPWEGQSQLWNAAQKVRYDRLVSECDYQTVVQSQYTDDCLIRRNRYMVDNASVLIAAYDGKSGGTRSTILYAMRSGIEVIQLPIQE
jgi:uncharacterized phage-like protein YoqJ